MSCKTALIKVWINVVEYGNGLSAGFCNLFFNVVLLIIWNGINERTFTWPLPDAESCVVHFTVSDSNIYSYMDVSFIPSVVGFLVGKCDVIPLIYKGII